MRTLSALFFSFLVASCSMLDTHAIDPDAKAVRLYQDEAYVAQCQLINEVIGSQGTWYTFLFISNKALTQGAVNDIKNQAGDLGANTVHIYDSFIFATSVTILGLAYQC